MPTGLLDLRGDFASDTRPARVGAGRKLWAKDPSGPEANDGTRIDATFLNDLVAMLRAVMAAAGLTPDAGDDAALTAAVVALIGLTPPSSHNHDARYYTEGEVDTALALKAPLASPTLTGAPTAPTQADNDNSTKIATTQYLDRLRGIALGLATLGADGKVPSGQLSPGVVGQVEYQSGWNASTNSPALATGTAPKGHYYVVTTAGSTNLDGITDWKVGDWAIANGSIWEKVDNTDAVASVAGLMGAISASALKTALAIAVADITDASANGRSFIAAANYAAMTALLAAMVGDSGAGGTKGLVPAPAAGDAAANKFLKANGAWAAIAGGAPDVIIEDQKAAGTDGGTFTAGANQTRDLNTLSRNNGSLASLDVVNKRFTLPAGTYLIRWEAPANSVNYHQSILYNYTDSALAARGTSMFSLSSGGLVNTSTGLAIVTIAGSKTFEIRHFCSATYATYGFGVASSLQGGEVYTRVEITKIA